ncbi:hypothetical protein EVAR_91375_1 [Eumeta japonica]|uniref:Uncharacterized protein n=1 Tax=Eumeta variegata TaxID=151549 RepID=A0A4C1XB86_EUMVA|nr:hypothetical protein EVAR_91375_1 [Eumeta japonica]
MSVRSSIHPSVHLSVCGLAQRLLVLESSNLVAPTLSRARAEGSRFWDTRKASRFSNREGLEEERNELVVENNIGPQAGLHLQGDQVKLLASFQIELLRGW